jgi:hypothetical protein
MGIYQRRGKIIPHYYRWLERSAGEFGYRELQVRVEKLPFYGESSNAVNFIQVLSLKKHIIISF